MQLFCFDGNSHCLHNIQRAWHLPCGIRERSGWNGSRQHLDTLLISSQVCSNKLVRLWEHEEWGTTNHRCFLHNNKNYTLSVAVIRSCMSFNINYQAVTTNFHIVYNTNISVTQIFPCQQQAQYTLKS